MVRTKSDFELIADWRRHLRALGRSEQTLRAYTSGVLRLLAEVVEGPPDAITEELIDRFMVSVSTHAPARALYARGIRSFCTFLHRRGHIATDPSLALDGIKAPESIPPVVLEQDELVRYMIAAAWRNPRRAWAIMLAFSIGCRRGELAGIAPRDLLGDKVRLRRTKGGRPRDVELNTVARVAIEELRPWYTAESILGGVNPQTITEWCHEAAEDSGLLHKVTKRPSHVLRASFATHLLRQGVPIHVVSKLLGHRSIQTTSAYLAIATGEREDAVARLPFAS